MLILFALMLHVANVGYFQCDVQLNIKETDVFDMHIESTHSGFQKAQK